MATIYDVALRAGVSAKTVSRVLNGDGPVGAATREAVEGAMRDLGYVPSRAAQSMRGARGSGLVGLVTGAISMNPEPGEPAGLPDLLIVQGIQQAVSRAGMTLMIADTGGRADRVAPLVQTFARHRAEGLIYVADHHSRVDLPAMPRATPVVLANCFDGGTPAVLPDDRRLQETLVARVIAAGHRRLGFLTLEPHLAAVPLRLAGYRDALARAGIAFDPDLVRACDPDGTQAGAQLLWDAIDTMLRLPEPPTVLLCGNDKLALRVYGVLRSRGVRVPDDLSVAGFDNHVVIAETLYPPLTTVELPYGAMGVRAAERLLQTIRDGMPEGPVEPILVTGPVHWRESVTDRRAAIHHLRSV